MSAKLVSIIGPPASGKTLLGESFAEQLSATLIREDYAGNPFLAASYVGSPQARLPGQLYFLLSRVKQLQEAAWPAEGIAVSDYGFCQDAIYARLRLDAEDFRIYEKVAASVENLVHPPEVIVSLDATVESLSARIAERGRDYESSMDSQFLAAMRGEYATVAGRAGCPVISVDTDAIDLRDPSQRQVLLDELRERL